MSYPNLPNNRMIVNGVDLSERFKMVLLDGYTLAPPSAKTYTVDIPCGNGVVDLTESLIGDITYNNREQSFEFAVVGATNFEEIKTQILNFLHGRSYDYTLTMDPGYTYNGRFDVGSFTKSVYSIGPVMKFKVKITAKPFKYKDPIDATYNAMGGNIIYLESGRESVRPQFISQGFLKIIKDGKIYQIPKGSWNVNEIILKNGSNKIYLSSYDIRNLRWKELISNNVTFGEFGTKPLYSWYKTNGNVNSINDTWGDAEAKTWNDVKDISWIGMYHAEVVPSSVEDVEIKYEWGDL